MRVRTPLVPPLRTDDLRPIDSADRSPQALDAMPAWRRVLTHPALLWLAGAAVFAAGQQLTLLVFKLAHLDPSGPTWTLFIAASVGYALLLAVLERRRPEEVTRRPLGFLIGGLVLGTLLMALVVGIMTLSGAVSWGPGHRTGGWALIVLLLGVGPAISEELIFRGIVFRYAEQGLGTWVAVALSAAIFGGAHLSNPNATAWGAVAIAIEAGVMLAVLYALTRSLWLVIGVHCAWNLAEGVLFGFPVSGMDVPGLYSPTLHGSALVTGGAFGPEASIVALLVCSAVSALAIVAMIRRGTVVRPAWRRQEA